MAVQFTQDVLDSLKEGFKNHHVVLDLIQALEAYCEEAEAFKEYSRELELRLFRSIPFGIPWEEFRKIVESAPDRKEKA